MVQRRCGRATENVHTSICILPKKGPWACLSREWQSGELAIAYRRTALLYRLRFVMIGPSCCRWLMQSPDGSIAFRKCVSCCAARTPAVAAALQSLESGRCTDAALTLWFLRNRETYLHGGS